LPELPEVETIVRLIRPRIVGRRFVEVRGESARLLTGRPFLGAEVLHVARRAKYILIGLRPAGVLVGHLRMTGRLRVREPGEEPARHTRLELALDDGGVLEFIDLRRFGRLVCAGSPEEVLPTLGPEPLGHLFTARWLHRALAGRRRRLKPLLLDQSFLAGLGNIYADESLHRARLHPLRISSSVSPREAARLHRAIRFTLRRAIELQGSSFDRFYRTPEGKPGEYQHEFRVYGRTGEPCPTCGAPIRKMAVAQRGTHFCPRCQPARALARPKRDA